jgi:hypothetical protein
MLLEHTAAPDDPAGLHDDLLLEEGPQCRTWRLASIPQVGGPHVHAVEVAPHRLAWLDHEAGEVSGGRGFARRVDAGSYEPIAANGHEPDAAADVSVSLQGAHTAGCLRLQRHGDHWVAWLVPAPTA